MPAKGIQKHTAAERIKKEHVAAGKQGKFGGGGKLAEQRKNKAAGVKTPMLCKICKTGPLDSLKTMETHYDAKHSGKWEEDKAHYEGLIAAAEEKE